MNSKNYSNKINFNPYPWILEKSEAQDCHRARFPEKYLCFECSPETALSDGPNAIYFFQRGLFLLILA